MKQGTINAVSNILENIANNYFESSDFKDEDAVIFSIIHSIVKKSEDIHFLLLYKRYDSVEIIGRTILELYVSLLYVLKGDTKRRALSYLYSYKMQIAKKLEQTINLIPHGEEILEFTEKERNMLLHEVPNASTLADYKGHYQELYNSLFSEGVKNKMNWYNLDGKISNFSDLMKAVDIKEADYYFFYGIGSLEVHGLSTIGNMTIHKGNFAMKSSVNLPLLNHKISSYLIKGINKIIKHYEKETTKMERTKINRYIKQMELNFLRQVAEDKL